MTGKVKLTSEQAVALEIYKKDGFNLAVFVANWRGFNGELESLKTLSVDEMARVLYGSDGYEIEPKHKYGDWVTKHYSDLSYLIGRFNQVRSDGMVGVYCSDENIVFIPYEELSASTPEEIKAEKERRFWAKIGREVGEFKKGDVGLTESGSSSRSPENIADWYELGVLKGFYPAESFISFEDGDSNA